MKNRKYILLCIPLLCVLLLTACHSSFGIEAKIRNLPQGTEPAFLVPDTDITADDLRTSDDSIRPRCTYHDDGWVALAMLRAYDEDYFETGVLKAVYGSGSKEQAIAMCERFRSFRIAAIGDDKVIVAISDEIPICEAGKLYAVRDFNYDFQSGETEITYVYRLKWHGYTADDWWFFTMLAAQIVGFLALIGILINALCNKKENAGMIEWLIAGCAAVPFLLADVLYLVMQLHPAFTPTPKHLDSGDILLLVLCNAMYLLILGGVGTHRAVVYSREKRKMFYEGQ